MRYLVKLTPLEPFMFGGEQTFGALGDKEAGSYIVKSRKFPQQSAILGMLKKEIMTQAKLLTRKRRGEWVDKKNWQEAINLVGKEKFDIAKKEKQDFGAIKQISPMFLMQGNTIFIKKVDIDSYPYEDGRLKDYNPKKDIYDNYISLDEKHKLNSNDIFESIEQVGNKKGGEENSLFKKSAYLFKQNKYHFAFYVDIDFELKDSIVALGADGSRFKLEVSKTDKELDYIDKNGYLTLLSDAYITVDIKNYCDFAITSEISYRNLKNKKDARKPSKLEKSDTKYLYEKGSIFINPSQELINNLKNPNLEQIGYNIFTYKGEN